MYYNDWTYKAEFKKISRKVFNEVADKIKEDHELSVRVTVGYTGTGSNGDLVIGSHGGHEKEFKKALRIFVNAYL